MNLRTLLFSFRGRISRLPYWIVTLILMGFGGASWQSAKLYGPDNPMTIGPAVMTLTTFIIIVWIGLAIQVKRWHDRGKPGYWALLNLIPFFGWIWVIVECGLMPGSAGANRFGNDPSESS